MDESRPDAPATVQSAPASQHATASLGDALGRLFVVAAVYSPEHPRVVGVAEVAASAIVARLATSGQCVLGITDETLTIDGEEVSALLPAAARMRQELHALGVSAVVFYRTIQTNDLVDFARIVRGANAGNAARLRFETVQLRGLPPSISVHQHDYGTPVFGADEQGIAYSGAMAQDGRVRGPGGVADDSEPEAWACLARDFVRNLLARLGHKGTVAEGGAAFLVPATDAVAPAGTPAGSGSGGGEGPAAGGGGAGGAGPASSGTTGPGAAGSSAGSGAGSGALSSPGTPPPSPAPAGERAIGNDPPDGHAPRTRAERLRAIEESVRRAIERVWLTGPSRSSAASILAEARRTLPTVAPDLPLDPILAGIRRGLDEHLRDALRGEVGATFDPAATPPPESEDYDLELPALLEQIRSFTAAAPGLKTTSESDGVETLSIHLFLLDGNRRPAVREGVERAIAHHLSRAMTPGEEAALATWMGDVASKGVHAVDAILPRVLEPLRRSTPAAPSAVLVAAAREAPEKPLRALWPHMAREAVFGLGGASQEVEDGLLAAFERLDSRCFALDVQRILPLLAGSRQAFSERMFSPPRPALTGLYATLLASTAPREAARLVVAGFRRRPPARSAACALVAFEPAADEARVFLCRVLREQQEGGESDGLRQVAAARVVSLLRGLDGVRRKEPWVPDAVRALGFLKSVDAVRMVEEIAHARRWMFVPIWPAPCRAAAREASSLLKLTAMTEVHGRPEAPPR
jgi:hypothetical protein